ncbi:MAG: M48 family metallopeptidase [Myxococcales bacterium]|jgi:predicted Zn-dependent protease
MYRLLVCLGLMALGCTQVAQATRPVTETVGSILLSPEEEKRLGDELARQVEEEEQVLQNQEVQDYIDQVGRRILDAVPDDEQRFDYTFTVLDDPGTVNAFALPGGHIYVMSGLIRAVDNEAELASVLAHEVAHVVADHPSQQLAAQVGLQTLAALALGNDPALLAQLAAQIAAQGYIAAHTREQEQEADTLGVGYLARAGYAPQAMAQFFSELDQMQGQSPGFVQKFFSTHPAPGERAQAIDELIQQQGLGPGQDSIVGGFEQVQSAVGGASKTGVSGGQQPE